MEYALTVLTNGRSDCLRRTLAAFEDHVTPRPSKIFIHIDGPHDPPPFLYGEMSWEVSVAPNPVGFTYGTHDCYEWARTCGLPWQWHMEDDFVILRPVDLRDIADVLDAHPHLAQMALVRTPWGAEIPDGGYIPQHPGQYVRKSWHGWAGAQRFEWMETTRNWATNPALMRPSIFDTHPWPLVPHSEGMMGIQMLERDPSIRFGLYGAGECWAAHVGVDRVKGSHGY